MNFSGEGFEVKENVSVGKSIKPGVVKARISAIEYFESSQSKTPGLKITIETPPVEGLFAEDGKTQIGQKASSTWWMSAGAWDIPGKNWCTKAKLTILADKLGLSAEFAAIKGSSAEDFVNKVSALFVGKKARFAVGGEWQTFEGDNGTITFIRPNLLTFGFVESLTEVPNDADTKLKVDENNSKHVKPLEVADDTATDSTPSVEIDAPWD